MPVRAFMDLDKRIRFKRLFPRFRLNAREGFYGFGFMLEKIKNFGNKVVES